jgi:hypothetical protein
MAAALSRLAISPLLAFVVGRCGAAETFTIAPMCGFSQGIGIAHGQNTEANANTQPEKPAWSCPCDDPFGHREIPESLGSAPHLSPWCNAFEPAAVPGWR